MLEAADLQGATLTDWLEEQVAAAMPRASQPTPSLSEVGDPEALLDARGRFEWLAAQKWAFTDEDTRFLTHDLHPYPAKFIPQIPAALIAALSMRGDVVCDPFGGSATTAVEAVRLGRRAVSLDANPLGQLIGRVKTGFMSRGARTQLDQLLAAVEGHLLDPGSMAAEAPDALRGRYSTYVPDIPHIDKWFSPHAVAELALVRHLIERVTEGVAHDAAQLALSRIMIRVSNQDSETRYVAVPKAIGSGFVLRAYIESLRSVSRRLENAALDLQFADARFMTADTRSQLTDLLGANSVDLIVTSPPYPNATDYHLYHRFRLYWLGFDPGELAKVEIGSHLRHQRNDTGFAEYREDMAVALGGFARVLQPGRYAALVVGDALFKGEIFSTSDAICEAARKVGLDVVGTIERPIHSTRRSFAKPARRARAEQLVVLQRPNRPVSVRLIPPAYRMWHFEEQLRTLEIESLTGSTSPSWVRQPDHPVDPSVGFFPIPTAADEVGGPGNRSSKVALATLPIVVQIAQPGLWHVRRLTFTRDFEIGSEGRQQPTWQRVLENGDSDPARRKDPKYVTHGLHPFKGKFYPQLAKALLNISGAPVGGVLLDPFCGSGTTLLEGMLNGFGAFGCDFNPLAAKISRAKTSILTVPRETADLSLRALMERVAQQGAVPEGMEQFASGTQDELRNWFAEPVLYKLNWLLGQIRLLGNGAVVDYLEVVVSSLVRDVSNQEPTDLRIRRRKEPLADAPVLQIFHGLLAQHQARLRKYWSVAGRQPGSVIAPRVLEGDSRQFETMAALGLGPATVDCVVTSPPYATALPYIDTDRLSLLAILGLQSGVRSELEQTLTGSREIKNRARLALEQELLDPSAMSRLPKGVVLAIRGIYRANAAGEVGFRRANVAALLWRYFTDMKANLEQVARVMKPGSRAFYVVGDSRTNAGGEWVSIETCRSLSAIAETVSLRPAEAIPIDVTTERYQHMKNAITLNQVIVLEKD
ncbi:MAG TPA: DNA methyltransferase [Patescibacteria group bacterium]|nr:DNA methyltransferase [Patescibacteria group bacterium]